ncbi:Poly(A) RNA polymerase [Blattella germanica]|nr:Poly(A) RNA polymerase [Blattella germanica]
MMFLHQMTCLSDLGSRLRFLTARQIELAVNGLFPKVTVLPFGSSVNSFGKAGCDLDLVLVTDKDEIEDESKNCRLVFQAKTSLANGRSQVQRHMEMLGDVCQLLLPGCSQVRRILQARVPIIKYHQDLTGIECDLSMTNMSAVYMSELLYIMGASDWRVRPLVFAVRTWAREVGLTNPTPGRWITNFSLTLLVLFYLQQHTSSQAPVLPTLNALISFAGPDDRRVTSDGVNCTFIRNISQLQKHMASTKKSPNKESLESLFIGFFEFYSSFDFSSHAVSLVYGNSIPKPEHSPLYIANPLERGFNVSKNVSHDETERLRIEFRNAAWILESVPLRSDKLKKSSELWGLTALFESPRLAEKGRNIFYIPSASRRNTSRIVDVSVLFQDDESESANKANLTLNSESNKENVVPGPPKHVKVEKTSGRVRRR